jgi:hypothetical protein
LLLGKAPVAVALAFSLSAGSALANGRFPNAQQLRELDERTLVVAGTYGMLVTTNGGADFAYQCEAELFGKPTGSYTVDPLLEAGPDGAIFSGSLHGLRVSRDLSCTFETEPSLPRNWSFFELERPPNAENGVVVDVCRRGGDPNAPVLALVAMKDDATQTTEHRLYESDAAGVFSAIGAPIATSVLDYGLTLEVAPSDPDRIYVTGTLETDPVLLVSDDGARSFRSSPLVFDDADFVLGAYIGAVAPSDPDRVYLRVPRRVQTDDGLYVRDDSVAVSMDGGRSVTEVLRNPANLLGFSLSLDGSVVLAGYGDPRVDETLSSRDVVGIYRADAIELVFERIVADMDVSCLRFTSAGLYACAVERDPLGVDPSLGDFHLGLYSGSGEPASAADFTPLLALRNVRGPAPWSDGRTTACDAEWTSGDPAAPIPIGTCARFNACEGTTELSEGALVCGATGGGGGGEGGSGAGAGAGGEGGSGSGSGADAGEGDVGGSGDGSGEASGCGCRVGKTQPRSALFGLALGALAFGCGRVFRGKRRRGRAAVRARSGGVSSSR